MIFNKLKIFLLLGIIFFLFIGIVYSEVGECVKISRHIYKREIGFGKKMRLAVGRANPTDKKLHQWAEYWNEDRQKWCLWDGADWRIGKSWYTAEETGYKTFYTDNIGWQECPLPTEKK